MSISTKITNLLLALVVIGSGCNFFSQVKPEDQRVVGNTDFRLRVSRFVHDRIAIMARSNFVIEAADKDGHWTKVYDWSQDEPWSVGEIELVVVNPTVGYFFNMNNYGVTLNAGRTWAFFNFYAKSRSDGVSNTFGHEVPKVVVRNDGTGSIYFQDYNDRKGNIRVVYETTDFGTTWVLASPKPRL